MPRKDKSFAHEVIEEMFGSFLRNIFLALLGSVIFDQFSCKRGEDLFLQKENFCYSLSFSHAVKITTL